MNMTFHFSLFSKASMNRQLQLVQKLQEDEPANLDEEHPKEKRPNGSTTLHQSSIVWWLSLSDLLESIKNAYPTLIILLNKNGQSARVQSINMDLPRQSRSAEKRV
jgi:hypothetical protein